MPTTHDISGGGAPTQLSGQWSTIDVDLTADSTTSGVINKQGMAFGTVHNESGASVTITYYGAAYSGGTALALKDQDGVAVTQVVADNECLELPSAVAGVAYLVPVLASGTATLTFHFER